MIIESTRLQFRLMDESDADALFELDQDPEVMNYLTQGRLSTRQDITEVYIPRMLAYRDPAIGWGMWHVSHSATDEYIGWVLARPLNFFNAKRDDTDMELGWRFKRAVWGQGFATEAARHIAQHIARGNPQITWVSAIAVPENLASIKVMQKLGMDFQGEYLHEDPLGNVQVVHYRCPTSRIFN